MVEDQSEGTFFFPNNTGISNYEFVKGIAATGGGLCV